MKLLYPKKGRLNYKESLRLFEDAEVPFEPFCCVEETKHRHGIKLLIGYTDEGSGIFLSDDTISSIDCIGQAEAYKVSNQGMNSYYKKVKRPNIVDSIFRKATVGDTLLCVADGRYLGCEFGETYTVSKITSEGRVSFDEGSSYTYENKYFIVIKSNFKARYDNNSIIDSSGSIVVGAKSGSRKISGQRKRFIESEDVKKQTMIVQDELITRKKIAKTLSRRNFFETKLIKRKTNNL